MRSEGQAHRLTRVLATGLAALLATGCANFHEVEPGKLYRTSQLSAAGMREVLDEYHIRTVIRLRGGKPGDSGFDATFVPTQEAGATFVHVPMTARALPNPDTLRALWQAVVTAERPVLVHCKAGADRSGLASALFILHETGDLRLAKEQLHVLPYLHAGWGRTDAMDQVLEMYEPYSSAIDFGTWIEIDYARRAFHQR